MLGPDEVILAKVTKCLPPKMRGKVPGIHLQLTPSLLDLLEDESGVEWLAQAAVKDVVAIFQSENKSLSQLVVVLVHAKIVEQLLAVQLRETTNNELEIHANVLKLPVDIELAKVLAMVFPGRGILFVARVLWRGLLSALVLGTRRREINEVLAPELRINQGLIGVEEPRDVAEAGFVARTWVAFRVQAGVNPLLFHLHQQVALPLPQL